MSETQQSNNNLNKNFTFWALFAFGIPSILLQLWTGVYQIFDSAIATQFNSANALATINILYPCQGIIEALAAMISTGGTAIIAKKFGEGKLKEANRNCTTLVIFNVILTFVLAIVIRLLGDNVWYFLGANDELVPLCRRYWNIHMFFMPLYCIQLGFQNYLIAAGKPKYCMGVTIAGGVFTLGMDYLLQGILGFGIEGCALGFGAGVALSAVLSLIPMFSKKEEMHFVTPAFEVNVIGEACKIGIAEFLFSTGCSIYTAIFNIQAMKYYGATGVAVISMFLYYQFVFISVYLGMGHGVAPIFSFAYGNKNFERVKDIFKKYAKSCGILLLVFGIGSLFVARPCLSIYGKPGDALYDMGLDKWVMISTNYVFAGISLCIQQLLTAFNDAKRPLIISLSRAVVFPIICLFALPAIFGGNGLFLVLPVAEAITAVIAIAMLINGKKEFHYM